MPGESVEADGFEVGDALWLKVAINEWKTRADKAEARELLAKLSSEIERIIVTFHYILGYSYAEIGEMNGLSEGAVKVAAHRAIKKLRTFM